MVIFSVLFILKKVVCEVMILKKGFEGGRRIL